MLVSYQPAFCVSGVFMMDGIGYDGWDETFEASAGSITGIGYVMEIMALCPSDGLQERLAVALGEMRGCLCAGSLGPS